MKPFICGNNGNDAYIHPYAVLALNDTNKPVLSERFMKMIEVEKFNVPKIGEFYFFHVLSHNETDFDHQVRKIRILFWFHRNTKK